MTPTRRLTPARAVSLRRLGRLAAGAAARPLRPGHRRHAPARRAHPGRARARCTSTGPAASWSPPVSARAPAGWSSGPTRSPACATTSSGFPALAARHPVVERLARTFAGVRLPATGLLFHRLLRAVLEQKVTGIEAFRAYRMICRHFGEPAPGPGDLLLPPDPAAVAATPYWVFHPFGVEQRRTQTLLRAARGRRPAGALRRRRRGHPAAGRAARHRAVDRGRGGPHGLRRPGRGERRRLSTSPTRWPGAWPASRAAPTPGCWSCWSRSAATAAGSVTCSRTVASGRRGSARACRSAHSPNSERTSSGRSASARPLLWVPCFPRDQFVLGAGKWVAQAERSSWSWCWCW